MLWFFIFVLLLVVMNVWTMVNSLFLYPLQAGKHEEADQKVSLLVPLRNEVDNVEGLIRSLSSLTYPNLEMLLLDDHSEDGTYEKLLSLTAEDARFTVVQGKELPDGWNGKVHACHQLSKKAGGDYLFFLDADARVVPTVIEKTLGTMKKRKAAMLSGFPFYPNHHFLSHMLVPLQHMVVLLHLPLFMANRTTKPMFTAACGIFIMIERSAYQAVGGHESVKESLVEDVHLAREMKKNGYRMILANITSSALSYMYESNQETWAGFKKNLYTGIGRSTWMVVFLTLLYATLFVLPGGLAIFGMISGALYLLLPYVLLITFKMYVDARTGHPLWLSFLMPVAGMLLIAMMWASMLVHKRGRTYQWKGRSYQ
ncbi:glycosyltransferase [Halobacillus kuroshimensis]|uniref:glycosyltransferase n=1 Tax=Halobacillus kuroshimensis TaxID=302481 RepID=UPI00042A2646|nr:glycosyltransferase family 2 protein [Halobacillus kuroshimensis]